MLIGQFPRSSCQLSCPVTVHLGFLCYTSQITGGSSYVTERLLWWAMWSINTVEGLRATNHPLEYNYWLFSSRITLLSPPPDSSDSYSWGNPLTTSGRSQILLLPFLVKRAAPISVSVALRPHSWSNYRDVIETAFRRCNTTLRWCRTGAQGIFYGNRKSRDSSLWPFWVDVTYSCFLLIVG